MNTGTEAEIKPLFAVVVSCAEPSCNATLAYNIACAAARVNDVDAMLLRLRRAHEGGESSFDAPSDVDFRDHHDRASLRSSTVIFRCWCGSAVLDRRDGL